MQVNQKNGGRSTSPKCSSKVFVVNQVQNDPSLCFSFESMYITIRNKAYDSIDHWIEHSLQIHRSGNQVQTGKEWNPVRIIFIPFHVTMDEFMHSVDQNRMIIHWVYSLLKTTPKGDVSRCCIDYVVYYSASFGHFFWNSSKRDNVCCWSLTLSTFLDHRT